MVYFAFDAALKDLEKLYKLLSIVKDRPSVGNFYINGALSPGAPIQR